MKRMHFLPLALASLLSMTAGLPAQDIAALLAADRQENEERFKTLNAKIDQLVEANEAYQKKIARLAGEVDKLKEEVERSKNDTLKDTVKRLEESIKEVDKQRLADNALLVGKLAEIVKSVAPGAAPPTPAKPPGAATPAPHPPGGPEKGYEYLVKSGDTGGTILQFYRDQGVKVSLRQLMEANPGVNWNKLKIGQKIFVPMPDK
jgi:gas vesicle protein